MEEITNYLFGFWTIKDKMEDVNNFFHILFERKLEKYNKFIFY